MGLISEIHNKREKCFDLCNISFVFEYIIIISGGKKMKIEHIGIWVKDLEAMRSFYEKFFSAETGQKYHNPKTGFTSYFLSFEEGARVELMHRADIQATLPEGLGLAHLALQLGDELQVDQKAKEFQEAGFEVLSGPRRTGDGYYEAVILDPEGNKIEITA